MTTDDRASEIHLRILTEKAEDSLARHSAWQDARERHAPRGSGALGSAYAAFRRQLAKNARK
jgi:hypothetical protein